MNNANKIAKAGKDFACGLYKQMPGALIPNPAAELLILIWDNFCDYPGNPGLPPPRSVPFTGGQCACVNYRLTIRLDESYLGTPSSRRFGANLFGAIQGIRFIKTGTDIEVSVLCRGGIAEGCTATAVWRSVFNSGGYDSTFVMDRAVIESVTRPDGLVDNCGSPPSKYPDAPPPPPGGFTSPPTPIVYNDLTTNNFIFNFVPPTLPPPPIGKLPDININFNQLNADFNFKIPIAFNFNGGVNFGGGGSDFNQDDRDNINNIKNITNNTNNTSNSTNNTTNSHYSDYRKDKDRETNKPPLPTDFDPPKPPVLPGKQLVDRLAFVEVNLTAVPVNAKSQLGAPAPNIVYAGWFEYTRQDKNLPREPIHFTNNCFIAPVGVDGYAFTLYDGFQGNAIAITNKA